MREFDEFVKMAATRWKKEMGNLSEESREMHLQRLDSRA